jgi:dihydroflavonol-4-reductase
MKIAVTGASGHLGNVLCRYLIEKNYQVKAFYNSDKRALDGISVELIQGDLLNELDVEKLVENCDIVFHCAAKISINGDLDGSVYATNAIGTQNVLNACKKLKIKKIIHVSSTHVTKENPQNETLTETRVYKTTKCYAYESSKIKAEEIMLSAFNNNEINGCVVRPSSIAGPYDFKPSEFAKALLDFRNKKIPFLPYGGYDFVDVRDVANAMINSIHNGKNGEIYHLTGKYYSIKEISIQINKITNVKVPKIILPFWIMKIALPFVKLWGKFTKSAPLFTIESISTLKNGHKNIDNLKARNDLNLNYIPISKTIEDFYKWKNNEY